MNPLPSKAYAGAHGDGVQLHAVSTELGLPLLKNSQDYLGCSQCVCVWFYHNVCVFVCFCMSVYVTVWGRALLMRLAPLAKEQHSSATSSDSPCQKHRDESSVCVRVYVSVRMRVFTFEHRLYVSPQI